LLGIRAVWKEDIRSTPAEMVYGESIRLPGQFLSDQKPPGKESEYEYLIQLRKAMEQLRPTVKRHGHKATFVFKDMSTTSHVFVRHDAPTGTLQPPYDGPYEVISRGDKTFRLKVKGKAVNISVDRLEPAYVINEEPTNQTEPSARNNKETTTRSGRAVRQPVRFAPI